MNKFEEFTKICTVLNQFTEQRLELYKLITEVVNYIRDGVYHDEYNFDYKIHPHHIYDIGTLEKYPDICCVTLYQNDDFKSIYFPVKFLCDDFKTKYKNELEQFIQSHLKIIYDYKVDSITKEIESKKREIAQLELQTKNLTNVDEDMIKLIKESYLQI